MHDGLQGYVDVVGTVNTLRRQRMMMVQSIEQYTYIYKVLRDFINVCPPRAAVRTEVSQARMKVEASIVVDALADDADVLAAPNIEYTALVQV